jgi:hypothetical protein
MYPANSAATSGGKPTSWIPLDDISCYARYGRGKKKNKKAKIGPVVYGDGMKQLELVGRVEFVGVSKKRIGFTSCQIESDVKIDVMDPVGSKIRRTLIGYYDGYLYKSW